MGGAMSAELGEASLHERTRDALTHAAHRLKANDETLNVLECPNHGIGDDGIEQLGAEAVAGTTHLAVLDVSYNNIGPAGTAMLAQALAQNAGCSLKVLNLGGNPVGLAGVEALCAWLQTPECGLEQLVLYNCGLTDDAALLLARMLQVNESLTHLCLDMNQLSARAAIMFAQALDEENNNNLAFLSLSSNLGHFSEHTMTQIELALERNAGKLERKRNVEEVKKKKAERRAQQLEAARAKQERDVLDERARLEEELKGLEEQKRREEEEVRLLEAAMAAKMKKKNDKAAVTAEARQKALESAIDGAYKWRDKVTAHGTLQKEWRCGFTIVKTEPGKVGGPPVVSTDAPRRLKACWCEPTDATALYANTLHYHCKWEKDQNESVSKPKAGDRDGGRYVGCRGSGHVCASVGYWCKPRPDLSPAHFFASPHPVEKERADAAREESPASDAVDKSFASPGLKSNKSEFAASYR